MNLEEQLMDNIIIPIIMWLSEPGVLQEIKRLCTNWYQWRLSKVYVPEGQEKHYDNMNKTIDTIFGNNKRRKK
jgi:hypothetical protein